MEITNWDDIKNEFDISKELSINDINKYIDSNNVECFICNNFVSSIDLKMYLHSGGIKIKEMDGSKQWVYLECPKCGYQYALWKIVNKICIKKQKQEQIINERMEGNLRTEKQCFNCENLYIYAICDNCILANPKSCINHFIKFYKKRNKLLG